MPDRPGHDRRYVLDWTKIEHELGWAPTVDVGRRASPRRSTGTRANREWWEPLRDRAPVAEGRPGSRDGDVVGRSRMKVLVTGAGGQLGHDVVAACSSAGDDVVAVDHAELDVDDRGPTWPRPSPRSRPDVVVHCAAWTAVDACESDPDRAFARQRRRGAMGARGERAASAPTSSRQHRLRVRRHARPAVPRAGRAEPAVGVRPVEARPASARPARTRRSCARRGCAASTASNMVQDGAAAAPPSATRWRSSTTSAAARRSPPTWRRCCAGSPSSGAPASSTSPTRAR